MTDTNLLLLLQSARDLFRAPVLPQQSLHHSPGLACNPGYAFLSAFQRQAVRLLRTIAALPSIALQFSAQSAFVYTYHLCDFRIKMSCLLKRINFVSFLLSKLVVESHGAP